jgi:catalase
MQSAECLYLLTVEISLMPVRLTALRLCVALLLVPLVLIPAARADGSAPSADLELAPKIVDALQNLAGPKIGQRKAHPKGVCFAGSFAADAVNAAMVTRSPAYNAKTPYPVTGRFSIAGPNPNAPDNTKDGRGLAVRLAPGGDSSMDLVLASTPMFAAATPQDFLDLLLALGPDPATGKPNGERIAAYLQAHPAPGLQRAWLESHPVFSSYATTPWFGIHAFRFTNAAGKSVNGKVIASAAGGTQGLSAEEAKAKGPDFLNGELSARLASGPARIEISVQIGEPGDPTDNPSVAWPDSRPTVHLGTLSIEKVTGQDCAKEVFMPTALTDGVDVGNDPLLPVRAAAYAVSYSRRLSGQ